MGIVTMFSTFLKSIVDDNRGATAIEYGLIVSLIVVAMIVSLQGVAGATNDKWDQVTKASADAMNN